MEPQVVTVTPDTTLAALADVLIGRRIGAVPVVQDGRMAGIVSRSDFARVVSLDEALSGLIAAGEWHESFAPGDAAAPRPMPPAIVTAMQKRTVGQVMVPAPHSVSPETSIREVARLLAVHHLHHVLVVEGETLRGVISALDIVRLVAEGHLVPAPA
jgi:CBS domain-containing protein